MSVHPLLVSLRKEMELRNYDAYIIPHGDQHDNEYIAEADERIKFISNFSGSNGLGLVTKDWALMWTDGRYYIQIEKELYPGWKMMKMSDTDISLSSYILQNLPKTTKIGMDFNLFSQATAQNLMHKLTGYTFINDDHNVIDQLWGEEKPKYPKNKVIVWSTNYTGQSVREKFKIIGDGIRKEVKKMSLSLGKDEPLNLRLLISRLDDIAWWLNLRGSDIPYNPVFFSFGWFYICNESESFHLFADKDKFSTPEWEQYWKDNKITLFNYEDILNVLRTCPDGIRTVIDSESSNWLMYNTVIETKKYIPIDFDIIEKEKSVKNSVELAGFRAANIRDCVALTKFFSWMEQEIAVKGRKDLNEYQIGLKNKEVRAHPLFMGESFAPICAAGANAAIIHYEQNENLHSDMDITKWILCDTGAQYMDGTTDITRTVHYGTAKKEEMEMYTRVLLGNLSLERLQFKNNQVEFKYIDMVARAFLSQVGLDYLHGTTHGVGHFLNVHESFFDERLKVGNVITNEPGYYLKDAFGIRIENMWTVVPKGKKFGFENITWLPYERNLIDMNWLSNEMVKYIDDFHSKVYETWSPFLKDDEVTLAYLKKKTRPLKEGI